MLSGLGLDELRKQGLVILTIVVAEIDGFFCLPLSIDDGFPHFEGDSFRNLLDPSLNTLSNSLDDLCSFLKSSFLLNFEGSISPVQLATEFFLTDEFERFFDFSRERVS